MLDYLALPLVLWLSAAAAWADLRTGRIPNRTLKLGLVFTLEWTALLAVWLWLGGPGRSSVMEAMGPAAYVGALFLDGTVAFGLAFILWWFGVWAAGDAKLFALVAFVMPLGFYDHNLLDVFPAFVLFFNTFAAMIVVLLVELAGKLVLRALNRERRAEARALLRRGLDALRAQGWGLVRVVLGFVAILMAVRVARHFAREAIDAVLPMNKTLVYVALFLLFHPLSRLLARRAVFAGVIAAIVAYVVYAFGFSDDPELRKSVVQIGWASLTIVALAWAYVAYVGLTEVRDLTVGEIRPGMILSDAFARELQENSQYNNERMGVLGPDGLTAEQVETLQSWFVRHDTRGLAAPAEIATTLPFAPAILAAVLITVVVRGYLFEI